MLAGALIAVPWDARRSGTLAYSNGARPLSEDVRTHHTFMPDESHRYLIWDVSGSMESTFHVDEGILSGLWGDATELEGKLLVTVPDGRRDRAVHWRITIDGEQAGSGNLKWLREYQVTTKYALHRTPHTISIDADWNGGRNPCTSFRLIWDAREFSRV